MKGIDTNLLVRYIVQDDALQSQQAAQFIKKECTEHVPGFINVIVLCELVWVLETSYEYERAQIAPVIEKILRTKQLRIHDSEIIWNALHEYKKSGGFADHCINHLNLHNGCEYTVTFDKKDGKLQGFKNYPKSGS